MGDFMLGLGISLGGWFLLVQMSNAQNPSVAQQQSGCLAQGGTWTPGTGHNLGMCVKNNAPVMASPTLLNNSLFIVGVPVALAVLMAHSSTGLIGTALGSLVAYSLNGAEL